MNQKEKAFVATVWKYYKKNGRHELPWRKTHDPYKILVSEIMLQQTQVDRVIPKYASFLSLFPTVEALAKASLGNVLRAWQGLGYNRRAKMLHECAKTVMKAHGCRFPKGYAELLSLPGIGPYTAGAVSAFAFNTPIAIIETNIRSVYIHHFFNDGTDVPDKELLMLVHTTMDTKKVREWFYALMDYGSYIKRTFGNPNSRSKHYVRQSTFHGSDRQIRGAILKYLAEHPATRATLHGKLGFEDLRIDAQIKALLTEELIVHAKGKYMLPE